MFRVGTPGQWGVGRVGQALYLWRKYVCREVWGTSGAHASLSVLGTGWLQRK